MKKISLRVRNFDEEKFLTFNIDNEAKLDEELFDFIEEEEPDGIVPVIFEVGEEFDTFSYDVTDKIPLKELFEQVNASEMVLKVLRGLVLALINMVECRISLSYLVLNRNYIYIDSDYKLEFICIPLEEMQEEVDLNGFLRNFLAGLRFEPSENGDYVAKLLTYVNNPSVFNLHNMVVLIESLMSDRGLEIPEEDSVEIYAEYHEVEEKPQASYAEEDFIEEDTESFDDDIITVFGGGASKQKMVNEQEGMEIENVISATEAKPQKKAEEEISEETLKEGMQEESIEEVPVEKMAEEKIEEILKEEKIEENAEEIQKVEMAEETQKMGTVEERTGEIHQNNVKEEILEQKPFEQNVEAQTSMEEAWNTEILEKDMAEEISKENAEDFSEEFEEKTDDKEEKEVSKKKFIKKEPKLKTRDVDLTGIVIEDDFDEFLAEQERKNDNPFHFDEHGLKMKRNIKINRASIVQNTREELEEELKKEDKVPETEEIEIETEEEDVKKTEEKPVRNPKKSSNGKKKVIPKVYPYLVRVNTQDRMMVAKQNFKIGKSSLADYTVEGNNAVSRVHAIITNKDGEYFIKDNKSTNHTYVNGKMLQDDESELLVHDSKIVLGDEEFEFKMH